MIEGVLVVDKPGGMTSHDVVATVKRRLGAKKVGHLGTLDPLATGVLPLVINRATKFATVFQGGVKEYIASMKLGEATDTYDAQGKVVASHSIDNITKEDIERVLMGFLGTIDQVPPMFSAVKRGGVPLYKLARAGVVVEREPKQVEIFELEILNIEMPQVEFRVAASRGTYVRSICHDAGEQLGVGAHLVTLKRTRSGSFTIKDAVELNLKRQDLISAVMPLDELLESVKHEAKQVVL
ncbi:tRNA pseudouridine(55) synthase [hydrothermal vent metagenome]|uniref:tRNA pseudouridine(55) synthase n=1 Tax=hydrothermal vent metagenome TaxID=652676 RepID=A0A3B0QPZ5_9ZZZZ